MNIASGYWAARRPENENASSFAGADRLPGLAVLPDVHEFSGRRGHSKPMVRAPSATAARA